MKSKLYFSSLIITSIFLSCATLTKASEPSPQETQHPIVHGQYSPPDLTAQHFEKIFEGKTISSWKKISGGFSGAKLYQVDADNHSYIVRSTGGLFGKAGIEQEITLMQLAGDAGIAPKTYYANIADGVVVMDKITNLLPNLFAPGLFKAWPELLMKVSNAIREFHKFTPHRELVRKRYMDVYFYDFVKHVNKNMLAPADLSILEKFAAKIWPRGKEVLSHNDIHARNFLLDGNRLYLIDWEMAGFGPEFYDVALFANMQAMTNEEGKDFLNLFLQRLPLKAEYEEFVAMRQLHVMMIATFNLLGAQQAENHDLKHLHTQSPPQTMRNFLFALDTGLLDVKNPQHLYENALVLMRYADYFS